MMIIQPEQHQINPRPVSVHVIPGHNFEVWVVFVQQFEHFCNPSGEEDSIIGLLHKKGALSAGSEIENFICPNMQQVNVLLADQVNDLLEK